MNIADRSATRLVGREEEETRCDDRCDELEIVRFALALHLEAEPYEIEEHQRIEEDLGLDPLDLVLVVLRLEELGEVEFPVAELEGIRTVGDLVAVVRRWCGEEEEDEEADEEEDRPPARDQDRIPTIPPPRPNAPGRKESGIHLRGGQLGSPTVRRVMIG